MLDLLLLVEICLHHVLTDLCTLLCEVGVVAIVYLAVAIVELDYLGHDLVEEITIVGDDDDASLVG